MKDLCLEIMKLNGKDNKTFLPLIVPDNARISRFRRILEQIKEKTGKKLLCVNWKSRFQHKNASPVFFSNIVNQLRDRYQALVFKDAEVAEVMQKEIEALNAPIINLSSHISDYHDAVAAISLVDAFISVDTGIVHAAGALGVPGVALFGPFPPETHISDYPSVIGIRVPFEGKACSGPCLETHRGCAEIDYLPGKTSPCFQAITPENVIEGLEQTSLRS